MARGSADSPDAVVISVPATLAGVIYDGHDLAEALRTGAVKVNGDMAAVERFLTLFALPDKAPARSEP